MSSSDLPSRIQWLIEHAPQFTKRTFLIELLTVTEHSKLRDTVSLPTVGSVAEYEGNLAEFFVDQKVPDTSLAVTEHFVCGLDYSANLLTDPKGKLRVTALAPVGEPAFQIREFFPLHKGMITNFKEDQATETTVGRFILNYVALVLPFGDYIPYVNKTWNIGGVEKQIAAGILAKELTAEQYAKYMNYMFFVGTFAELCVPVFSRKSLVVDPKIPIRKQELFEQYKDQLNDPLILTKIEDELIAMDKASLADDPSYGFFASDAKKFNVHRKRQYITGGLLEDFDRDKSRYTLIPEALTDGWDVNSFATWCNEVRRGSYNRGVETAKGGEQSKYLLRIFQNTKITQEDCGTLRGLTVTLTEELAKQFLGRYMIQGKTITALTSKNYKWFLGKEIIFRSLMYCECPNGFCYKCAGDMFRSLDVKAIGVMSLEIGSAFLSVAMASMHGIKMQSMEIEDIADFFV